MTDDPVNHPSHYGGEDNPYEAIRVIRAWKLGFSLGNTIKYIARAGKKTVDFVQDLKKARWYLDEEIASREREAAGIPGLEPIRAHVPPDDSVVIELSVQLRWCQSKTLVNTFNLYAGDYVVAKIKVNDGTNPNYGHDKQWVCFVLSRVTSRLELMGAKHNLDDAKRHAWHMFREIIEVVNNNDC